MMDDDPILEQLLREEELIEIRTSGRPLDRFQTATVQKMVFEMLTATAGRGETIYQPRQQAELMQPRFPGVAINELVPMIQTWIDAHAEPLLGVPQVHGSPWHGPRITVLRGGLAEVTFRWHTQHGRCQDCGVPAAFLVVDAYGPEKHQSVCAVCAANAAAEGSEIARISE